MLALMGQRIWSRLVLVIRRSLQDQAIGDPAQAAAFTVSLVIETGRIVGPILVVVMLAVLITLWGQVGWNFTLHPLTPSLSKLNPISGFGRLFSGRSWAAMVINLGKLAVVTGVAYVTLLGSAADIIFASMLGASSLVAAGAALTFKLGVRLALVLLLMALVDFVYQRYRHERDLRMTREEVKDELRSMEGDPVVKQRRRKVQQQLALQRLRRDVPKADVVVTNPTHVAVAIQYDAATMPAPKVLAKGGDYMALRIRQIAAQFRIPIVQRPTLARMMFNEIEVGQVIPEKFYKAMAEILAYVYRLSGKAPRGIQASVAPVSNR
jgi:flagellar biosynthetic protein FlhB